MPVKCLENIPSYIFEGVLNLRSTDCDSTPYFISYLTLNFESAKPTGTLYTMREKVTPEVEAYLTKLNIAIKDYDTFLGDIAKLNGSVYLDTSIANSALYETLPHKDAIVNTKPNIIDKLKAIKNPVEIQGFVNCHVRDGAAIVKY